MAEAREEARVEARVEAKAEAKLEAKARSMDPAIAAAIRAKEARAKAKLLKGASRVSSPSRLGLRAEM